MELKNGQESQTRRDHRKATRSRGALSKSETTGQAVRAIGVTEQTYYRWRKEYGGLQVGQAKRMKEMEKEISRLRKAISDLTLDNQILQEVIKGKF